MSSHDDDLHDDEPSSYKLSQPKQSLAAYQEMVVMKLFGMQSRSVSATIPAPPPPTPLRSSSATQRDPEFGAVDLETALSLLFGDLEASLPFGLAPACPPAAAAAAPATAPATATASASLASPVDKNRNINGIASEVLTTAGHGGEERGNGHAVRGHGGPGSPDVAVCLACRLQASSTDANDESLQRYKQSLGLSNGQDLSDPNDPRVCIIQSLTMESPGRDPVVIDLSAPGSEATLKDHPFKIKEGARFSMVAAFKVQHEVLSGLRYVQAVKRKGIRVSKDTEMIGSYAPNTDKQPIYTKRFQEDEAPTGMLARGHYQAISSFVDDDQKTHLSFEWSFDISKDW